MICNNISMDIKQFASRKDLYLAGLHNSHQKGIGRAKDGTGNMSIVLSGGYVDDEDFGNVIIYTGEGGRDEKTGLQIADQTITGGNKNLLAAFESDEPVYVTRGSKHKSPYSPKEGYELAGVYYISKHWIEKGRDGYDIVRFNLVSESSPINFKENEDTSEAPRVEYTSTRIIRETKIAKQVKDLYGYECQVCRQSIELPTGGRYAEAAHIKPLGKPHNGPDIIDNLLCLCPNHHLMFDKYCYSINPESLALVGIEGDLFVKEFHSLDKVYIKYHYENYTAHQNNDA
jgi:putative restriction endonuclease